MKSVTWTIFAFALSSAAAPLPPEGSFRLTVEELVQSDYCRVLRLKVQARPKTEMMELRHENGASGSVGLASTAKGKAREATMTLASMLSEGNSVYHVEWLLEGESGTTTSRGTFELRPGATLASVVSISITNGLYPLDRPLLIGRRDGEAMRLVVGSWNWESVRRTK